MADKEFLIEGDSPVKDELMFWCIAGYECFGRASAYELRVLSKSDSIAAKSVLGYAFNVIIAFEDEGKSPHKRHAQGQAVRFMRMGKVGRYYQYHITLRSWFWLLSKRINSRIFQDKPVLDIYGIVIDGTPLASVKKASMENVLEKHLPRRYCVQHQERDDAFLSRLLEDEGVYYWFDAHDAPGTMHLSDTSTVAHSPLPAMPTLKQWPPQGSSDPRFNELVSLRLMQQASTGAFASRDVDFKTIRKTLLADKADPAVHELVDFECFEFPGGYFSKDDTDQKARLRMEELAARRELFQGLTNWPDVAAGKRFRYEGLGFGMAPDTEYVIAGCVFCVRQPGYEGLDTPEQIDGMQQDMQTLLRDYAREDPLYASSEGRPEGWLTGLMETVIQHGTHGTHGTQRGNFGITAVKAEVPFRPPRGQRRAPMPGPQTAIVVGPAGEEIHADDFGRVKVQFHWDRYGKHDENSTCWLRVLQTWAGQGWGAYFIPRIGQEVIVDFLNGDPDRPVIIGRVYNDDQPIPFASHTQSGIRTRSTPGGNASNFNELRFEDQKGEEQVYLHAERNYDTVIEKRETRKVGTDSYTKVVGEMQLQVGQRRTADIGANDVLKVVGDQSISIGGSKGETVNGTTTFTSFGNWKSAAPNIDVKAVSAYKLAAVSISAIATASYGIEAASYSLKAPMVSISATTLQQKASATQEIKAGAVLNMGAAVVNIDAQGALTLSCGASQISMTPGSITISAPIVTVNGTGMASVIGGIVKINA